YKKRLLNGLQVFLLPKQGFLNSFALFTTNYGSIDQTFMPINKSEYITVPNGIAHFLEHKLFEKKDYDVFDLFLKQSASLHAYKSCTNTDYIFKATDYLK